MLLQKIDQLEQKNIKQKTERDETNQESKDLCNDNARLQLEKGEMARSSGILHLSRNAHQKQRSRQNSSDVISRKMWMSRAERKIGFSERSTQLPIINRDSLQKEKIKICVMRRIRWLKRETSFARCWRSCGARWSARSAWRCQQPARYPCAPRAATGMWDCASCLAPTAGEATSLLTTVVIENVKHECKHKDCKEMVHYNQL
jgi:hypothetical protein